MTDTRHDWINITTIGSSFEEELDLRADPQGPEAAQYRHREYSFSDEEERDWLPGPAPK